jgi:hypothetical protein
LLGTEPEQNEIDFEATEVETYICGNPPYLGGKKQNDEQKRDMALVFGSKNQYQNLDYVCSFFMKACHYLGERDQSAFVSTSSISQGTHVPTFWPRVRDAGCQIFFCYETFKWSNNATNNAGVYCTIIGLAKDSKRTKYIFGNESKRLVKHINAYLVDGPDIIVEPRSSPDPALSPMITGNAAYDGGNLFLSGDEKADLLRRFPVADSFLVKASGTSEFIDGKIRWCLWLDDENALEAEKIDLIRERISKVLEYRKSGGEVASTLVARPHQFRYRNRAPGLQILVPQVSSENREYWPVGLLGRDLIITHLAHAIYRPNGFDLSILSSKMHYVWASTLSGRLGNGIRYSSNLCWNAFPVPPLTEKNKADLSRCADDILLAREAHFPATIADLYDPDEMPDDLRAAHERNDDILERIYIGRRFKNDTERLEKLFDLYTKMTANNATGDKSVRKSARKGAA